MFFYVCAKCKEGQQAKSSNEVHVENDEFICDDCASKKV